ncbi:hypothetical protein EDD37DRAFT_606953 [Exophiala viscosa]|uniref:PAS domain-containing protein n=1 Tax=Exophiala viscosa TaxID=2486360 RepID=A0AAN6IIS4_9EURO|nr:hypothetical protein EDD36DRAFT_450241 [Exophiala viscosa]KAI1628173.1 hypothetical protein EDD37DRAFT_606953 [Exophiala viscosa]
METVFITIHDLSLDARMKYCSDSIEDILGYLPNEVVGRSCWEYFHPDEIPFAREIHGRGISLDKAAVLNYCRIRHRDGSWIGCECVFTVVHDVLVASTAIYRRGPKARQRALDGAGIRRIFSSSPRDPRYHMLSYLSNKFYQEPSAHLPEPRAALFLNRFTRTSTIMYATNGVSSILGLQPSDMVGKSFYECIEANCLQDAIKCLESAKANDSIAYLRFWYRNPLRQTNGAHSDIMPDDESDEDEEGGVRLRTGVRSESSVSMTDASTPRANERTNHVDNGDTSGNSVHGGRRGQPTAHSQTTQSDSHLEPPMPDGNVHRTSSDVSTFTEGNASDGVFDRPITERRESSQTPPEDIEPEHVEIEAVVSCSSDGLVVILRRARPLVPHTLGATEAPYYANGLFASPWAPEPLLPQAMQEAPMASSGAGSGATRTDNSDPGFMAAIRDVAVFAWSLTGINGSLAQYAHGHASGEALPLGLPVWDPNAKVDEQSNELYNGFLGSAHRSFEGMDEPAKIERDNDSTSSEDEVVWKRTAEMPPWRRPKRRAHEDAFGSDGHDGIDGQNEDGGRKRATRSYTGSGSASASSGLGSGSGPSTGSGSGSGAGSATDSV